MEKEPLNSEEEILLKAIVLFDQKSNELANIMAKKFDLNLNEKHPFSKLLSMHNNLRKGKLNDKWVYWFHGDSCEYKERITQQVLEIRVNRQNHSSFNDWTLFHFIETSQSLTFVFSHFDTCEKVNSTITSLEKKKQLIRIGEFPINDTFILNKKRM